MIVVSISGPCGSGKSTLINLLSSEFEFLSSVYKNCKGAKLDPTSYESKVDYSNKWFEELLLQKEKGTTLILSDRSPFDSLAYLQEKIIDFKNEILSSFKLLSGKNIFHYSILLTASKEELEKRIKDRYINGNRNEAIYLQELLLLDKSLQFYNQNISFYKFVLDNTFDLPNQTLEKIRTIIDKINNK